MDEFTITKAWLHELRMRAHTTGWVSLSAGQTQALVDAAERDLQRAGPAKILRFSKDGIVPK